MWRRRQESWTLGHGKIRSCKMPSCIFNPKYMISYPIISGQSTTPDSEGNKPACLILPNQKTGKVDRIYFNLPIEYMICGLIENVSSQIVFPTFDLMYSKNDTTKALRVARQMTHQKRSPKVYIYPEDKTIHVAVVFRVKPIPDSLPKAIIPNKMQSITKATIDTNTELVSIAESSFEKEPIVERIFPHFYRANMFDVTIGKRIDNHIVRLWKKRLESFVDSKPDRI